MTNENYEHLSELLARLQPEVLKEFTHRCIDEICGRRGPDQGKICSSGEWTIHDFSEARKELKSFLLSAVVNQYDKEKIESSLPLNGENLQGVVKCLAVRNEEIREYLLEKIARTPGVSLQDFDWKLKMVMGSSSISSLQQSLVQLDLFTKEQHLCEALHVNPPTKNISVELDRDSLSSLINALQAADESLLK